MNVPVPLAALAGMVIEKSGTAAKSAAPASPLPDTITATGVACCRRARSRVAVTVTEVGPSPSDTRSGTADNRIRVDGSSSSASVTVVGVTGRSDAPDTVSVSSASTVASSRGVSVNVPAPLAAFAAMVIVKSATAWKSTASGFPLPATDTVTVVAVWRAAPFSDAVTLTPTAPPSSDTSEGDAESTMPLDAISSSVSVTEVFVTGRSELPSTVSVSLLSATSSSSGVRVNVQRPLVAPAAIMIFKSRTDAKSTASGSPLPVTSTVTVVGTVRAPASRVAVTSIGVAPAPSDTVDGTADRTISVEV